MEGNLAMANQLEFNKDNPEMLPSKYTKEDVLLILQAYKKHIVENYDVLPEDPDEVPLTDLQWLQNWTNQMHW